MKAPTIRPLGDTAITVAFGEGISVELNQIVTANATVVRGAKLTGVTDVVASYASLAVHFDPSVIAFDELRGQLTALAIGGPATSVTDTGSILHTIPVTYDGDDLHHVSRETGLDVEEISRIHGSVEYRAFVVGFVPGFAYLGALDHRLVLPRRKSPRPRVPPGSVAIAEQQTGVYPAATPGGWHIIGTTTMRMFDPGRPKPSLLSVGDRVRFEIAPHT